MKHNYRRMKNAILIFGLFATMGMQSQNITLSFANAQQSSSGSDIFYEADVMIASDTDFKLGSGQVYIDYDNTVFGTDINANGALTITYPESGGYICGQTNVLGIYSGHIAADNANDNPTVGLSRLSFAFLQSLSSASISVDNVTSTPAPLFHIQIKYLSGQENNDPQICFPDNGTGGTVFQDQFTTACGPFTGGVTIANCPSEPGTQLTSDLYDCTNSSPTSLNIEEVSALGNIGLFPNPAKESFSINGLNQRSQIVITNLNGQVVKEEENYERGNINTASLSSGLYIIKISNTQGSISKKLVIE